MELQGNLQPKFVPDPDLCTVHRILWTPCNAFETTENIESTEKHLVKILGDWWGKILQPFFKFIDKSVSTLWNCGTLFHRVNPCSRSGGMANAQYGLKEQLRVLTQYRQF